ncbi:TetR/AcrR family transcriptional regulator [Yoonia sp. F2084L]|uniref:TetR/AcrR family transcriptional regulator n=1 Tax=Yoonia sp. F2084L TaxID=2926419 RepID=UPI001FF33268|nr:TetR/AcrR family transcriptional regulator [Yoonia sp. F2084L]MCK0094834.1 TetR/AcrR family transcriptional regulator [Yoonia sp. F2084L]
MTSKKQRLGPQEWINAGFRALTHHGPEGLRVEPIARALGTTKGSFYWHFKDLDAFQRAMLRYWEEAATHRIIAELEAIAPGLPRLKVLAAAVNAPHDAQGGSGAEAAIRGWARTYAPAGVAVTRVDDTRLSFLRDCLTGIGVQNPAFAALLYGAHIGLEQLSSRDDIDAKAGLTCLIDLIVAQASPE